MSIRVTVTIMILLLMHRSEYMYQIRVIQTENTYTEEHKNMLKME